MIRDILKYYFNVLVNRLKSNEIKLLLIKGRELSEEVKNLPEIRNIEKVEYRIFSQWGDDGIVQFLAAKLNLKCSSFIEFGVENYLESNTRFLLINNNWSGLVLDSSKWNVRYIKNDPIYYRHDIIAKHAFITVENINEHLSEFAGEKEIGLLSIDIDGNDYWVWKAITVTKPVIIVCEYNNLFGNNLAITIPYDKNFTRSKAHKSNLFFGASLPALKHLANEKGYEFICSNSAGCNAYFIRKDHLPQLASIPEFFFPIAKYREKFTDGKIHIHNRKSAVNAIIGMKVWDVEQNTMVLFNGEL